MTSEQIVKFVEQQKRNEQELNIHFKDRQPVTGIFIKGKDYDELKSKNLWRVVSTINLKLFKQNRDMNLSRIFNGMSFTRLSDES